MRTVSFLRCLALVAVLVGGVAGDSLLGVGKTAQAQARFVGDRPGGTKRQIEMNFRFSSYYGYGWYDGLYGGRYGYWGNYAVGPGFQMLFPIVHNGFIPSINNAFYIGFFTDFMLHPNAAVNFNDYFFSFAIGPMVQWRFFLVDILNGGNISAFANLGFGIWPWFTDVGSRGHYGTVVYGFPLFEIGGNVFFTRNVGLTLSFGYPSAKLGLSIAF